MLSRIHLRFSQIGKPLLDLRDQGAHELRRIVPVGLAPANEVMRHHGTSDLASRQPRGQQRALTYPRAARHHHPAIATLCDQKLVEPCQRHCAADEAFVALSLEAVVEALPGHPYRW